MIPRAGRAFLIAAFDHLLNEGNLINAELTNLRGGQQELFRWDTHILRHNLFGVDINSEAIEITKLSLWLKTANPREPLTYLDDVIRNGNSVVQEQGLVADPFNWSDFHGGSFDVVVANPPYVSMLELSRHIPDGVKNYWKSTFEAATGAYDLFVLFMELALRLVRDHGRVGLITPNKYVAAPYGIGIRSVIRAQAQFCGVLDVSRDRVFQDPSVYPIVSILKKTADNNEATSYSERDKTAGRVNIVRTLAARDLDALPDRMFSLLISKYSAELSDVLARSTRLEDIAEVNATSTAAEADMLSKVIAEHAIGATPLVNTGTIDRYLPLWGICPLVAQRRSFTRPAIQLGDVRLSEHRRHIYGAPKLIFAKMALRPEVFLDATGEYCSINTNCVYDADVPLTYLLGVLNSKALAFIYDQFFGALRMSGGYLQFQAPQLRALPIPNADDGLIAAVCAKVDAVQDAAARLLQIKREFIGLLLDDFTLQTTTRKLGRFEVLTWNQFATEIQQQGIELSGRAREDWHARFEQRSAEAAQLNQQIAVHDAALDDLVSRAYGLDPALLAAVGDDEGAEDATGD